MDQYGETLFQNALGFRLAANDLQKMMNDLGAGHSIPQRHATKMLGYVLSLTVLRALSTECMLKAIASARSGSFDRVHDLSQLYAALDAKTKLHIERVADSCGVASPKKILDRHRTDFVDWRYPFEGDTTFLDLDRVLQVLENVYRQISAGKGP